MEQKISGFVSMVHLKNRPCIVAPFISSVAKRTVETKKMRSKLKYLFRDPILFVGGPWRATADLVRGRVLSKAYRSPPCTMWENLH